MTIKLGVVMDPIQSIHFKKDSTLAMLFAAAERKWEIYYFEQKDLFVRDGHAFGLGSLLQVYQDATRWFAKENKHCMALKELNVLLMRKDPPFDQEYIYTTYILEHAEREGVLVMNKPRGLRDANEKFFTTEFPQCCPATLVTRRMDLLKEFFQQQQDIVCKPLEAMGGTSVFRVKPGDVNANVIFEMLTQNETQYIMAQRFIPAIEQGDKRLLLIDGEPIPFALVRKPGEGEWRGNLARGASGYAEPLTTRDDDICQQVGPVLRQKGLYFVGLDVIGDFLTEINVTSPTGIRELDEQCQLNIGGQFLDCVLRYLG